VKTAQLDTKVSIHTFVQLIPLVTSGSISYPVESERVARERGVLFGEWINAFCIKVTGASQFRRGPSTAFAC
jgi:hypothetical protein